MTVQLHGIIPIVYTPFDKRGLIDSDDVRSLVNYLIDSGVHGLAAVGGASECHKLTRIERKMLAEIVVDQAQGRVPVIVGVSATNISDSLELAGHAGRIGAAGIFATPPLFGKWDYPALEGYYSSLAWSVDIPIIVQDADVPISLEQIIGLGREIETVRYVKEEAPESGHRITKLVEESELTVLSGGSYLLDDLFRGVAGAIPGSVGVADLATAFNCFREGDYTAARAAYDHFLPLAHWRRQFPLLGAKEVLHRIGVFKAAHMREPAGQRMDEFDYRELTAIMNAMGPPY